MKTKAADSDFHQRYAQLLCLSIHVLNEALNPCLYLMRMPQYKAQFISWGIGSCDKEYVNFIIISKYLNSFHTFNSHQKTWYTLLILVLNTFSIQDKVHEITQEYNSTSTANLHWPQTSMGRGLKAQCPHKSISAPSLKAVFKLFDAPIFSVFSYGCQNWQQTSQYSI